MLCWIEQHFQECQWVVLDYLNRFNQLIFKETDPVKAEAAALAEGRSYQVHLEQRISAVSQLHIRVLSSQVYLNDPHFLETRTALEVLYQQNSTIRDSLEATAGDFLARRRARGQQPLCAQTRALELSVHYLLEEIAIYSTLVAQGWAVEVYPGPELPLLKDFALGKYPGIPAPLKQRINVELRIQKRK